MTTARAAGRALGRDALVARELSCMVYRRCCGVRGVEWEGALGEGLMYLLPSEKHSMDILSCVPFTHVSSSHIKTIVIMIYTSPIQPDDRLNEQDDASARPSYARRFGRKATT